MVEEGTPAPDFEPPSDTGETVTDIATFYAGLPAQGRELGFSVDGVHQSTENEVDDGHRQRIRMFTALLPLTGLGSR